MNAVERVLAAVEFRETDRVPVISQVFGHAAVRAGVSLGDYLRDGELLARCQIAAWEQYGYDAVFAFMDTAVEAGTLGSKIGFWPDRYPVVESPRVVAPADIGELSLPDPLRDGRMPELLKAVRILRREVGDEALVVGCALGPMTLATQLMGMEAALFMAIDDPERFERLLDFTATVTVAFGRAQIDAGAHLPMVFDPSASPAIVPGQFYRELLLPRTTHVMSELKAAGALANWLHITGPIDTILPYYVEAGVDVANIDYMVSPESASAALPNTCLDGNLTPMWFVEAEPDEITTASVALLDFFSERGGFILSPGCEIPLQAKPENVMAMVKAAMA